MLLYILKYIIRVGIQHIYDLSAALQRFKNAKEIRHQGGVFSQSCTNLEKLVLILYKQ